MLTFGEFSKYTPLLKMEGFMSQRLVPAFFLTVVALSAQSFNNGTFLGTVTDPSGAGVPGASVRIARESTQFQRETTTDAEGNYALIDIPVGDYRFEFEKSGFRKLARAGISLSAGQSLRVTAELVLGSVSEMVEVEAKLSQVDTNTANVGSTVSGSQVQELALATRSFSTLVMLQPGVNSNESQQPTSGNTLSFSVNGGWSHQNNWLLNGGRNADTYNGNNQTMVNLDAIAEVRIERAAYSAEFGRNAGGQINVITKSGTNAVHGSAFEFFRNDKLDARNFFATAQPKHRYNNYGFTVGGPIKRDKLFVFLSNEYRPVRRATTQTTIVPTSEQIAGDFTGGRTIRDPNTSQPFPNSRIPASRLDPNAQLLLKNWYVLPTPGFRQGALNYTSSLPGITSFRSGLGRLDYNISPTLTFAGNYNLDSVRTTSPYGSSSIPNVTGSNGTKIFYVANGSLNWTIRPDLLNEFTTAYYHGSLSSSTDPRASRSRVPNFNVPRYFSTVTDASGLIPSISMSQSYASLAVNTQNISHYSYEVIERLSYIKGSHTIQFGGSLDRETKTQNNNNPNNSGTFSFDGSSTGDALADLVLGRAYQYAEASTHITGTCVFTNFGFYVQDRFRVRPRLTLTYGIRWEYFQPEQDYKGTMSFFDPKRFDFSKAAIVQANGQIVKGTENFMNGIVTVGKDAQYGYALTNSVRDTFAPRVGFSYALTRDNLTVVRGGYGMFHDRWPIYASQARRNYPFNEGVSIFNTSFSNPAEGQLRLFPLSLSNFGSPWEIPYMQKWSLDVQRQLPADLLLSVGYVGTRNTHLILTRDINQPLPSAAAASGQVSPNSLRPYPGLAAVSTYETTASSHYHGLQVSLVKRFSGGLSIQSAYTFSKTIWNNVTPMSSYASSRLERAMADFDRTHVLVSSYVWELPLARKSQGWQRKLFQGWQVSGISSFQSGNPLTIGISGDRAGVGSGGQRPNLTGSVQRLRTMSKWFSTDVFAQPALGTFGNAGRSLVRGPGINNWDVTFSKKTAVTERVSLQFRAEFFNLFNHTQWTGVGTAVGSGTFGQVTSTRDPRITQLGLRLLF